jgi:hypothetical protein
MPAPAGLNSGAAPEPIAGLPPLPQAAEPGTAEPKITSAVPKQAVAEPDVAAAEPEPVAEVPAQAAAEPLAATGPLAAEVPAQTAAEQAEPAGTGNAAAVPDPGLEPAGAEPVEPVGKARGAGPLAVAATILGTIALAGAAVAVLAVVTHGFRPKTVVTYRPAAVFGLRAGECIDSSPNGLSVTVRSCVTPHDAEVFATFRLTGSSWPGSAIIQTDAGNGCVSRVAAYLNPQLADSGLIQEYVFPDQQDWQAGIRTVVCEIRPSSGQLTGSVRQAG